MSSLARILPGTRLRSQARVPVALASCSLADIQTLVFLLFNGILLYFIQRRYFAFVSASWSPLLSNRPHNQSTTTALPPWGSLCPLSATNGRRNQLCSSRARAIYQAIRQPIPWPTTAKGCRHNWQRRKTSTWLFSHHTRQPFFEQLLDSISPWPRPPAPLIPSFSTRQLGTLRPCAQSHPNFDDQYLSALRYLIQAGLPSCPAALAFATENKRPQQGEPIVQTASWSRSAPSA